MNSGAGYVSLISVNGQSYSPFSSTIGGETAGSVARGFSSYKSNGMSLCAETSGSVASSGGCSSGGACSSGSFSAIA